MTLDHTNLPIHKALLKGNFQFARTQTKDGYSYHGYSHPDGRAAVFSHNGTAASAAWRLDAGNKEPQRGTDAKELATLLTATTVLPPPHIQGALRLLGKLTEGSYSLEALMGDAHYGDRLGLLKKLRNGGKVLAKEAGITQLRKEFHAVLKPTGSSAAAQAAQFMEMAKRTDRLVSKVESSARKVEQAKVDKLLRTTLAERIVPGPAPIPKPKRKTKHQERKEKEALRQELAAKVEAQKAALAEQELNPKAAADVDVPIEASAVRLLEDPRNGIVLLQVEKSNSQGAVCVYNNGKRVAAGVVPSETLKVLRPVEANVLQAANQLLSPIVDVPVTPTAHRHLTAVLNCKELLHMETTNKKFAAPVKAAKKTAAEKPAKKTAAPKAESTGRVKYDDAQKIVHLVKSNLYREGTKAHATYELLAKAKTVGDFRKAVEKSKEAVYDATYFLGWASVQHGSKEPQIKVA